MDSPNDASTKLTPGDACPRDGCDGRLATYSSYPSETTRIRYFCCPHCRCPESHGKFVLPVEYAPPRPRRSKRMDLKRKDFQRRLF